MVKKILTYDKVVPSPLPDDLLHPMLISSCDAISNHKDEDELYVIAQIKNDVEACGKFPSECQLHHSNPDAGH